MRLCHRAKHRTLHRLAGACADTGGFSLPACSSCVACSAACALARARVLLRNGLLPLLAFCSGVAVAVIEWLDAADGGGESGTFFDES